MRREAIVLALAVALVVSFAASCGNDERSGPRVRIVLEPEPQAEALAEDLEGALDGAVAVLIRRVDAFELPDTSVERVGKRQIVIDLPGTISAEEAIDKIGRTALLQFCEAVVDEAGDIAIVREGAVSYQPQSCEPVRDAEGNIAVEGGEIEFASWPPRTAQVLYTSDDIVWQPATAEIDGEELAMDGTYLNSNTAAVANPNTVDAVRNPWLLVFQWREDGSAISEQVTERLIGGNYPLAAFLDGEPIRGESGDIIAPRVVGVITSQGSITGLSQEDAEELSTLLNAGALPITLRVVEAIDIE